MQRANGLTGVDRADSSSFGITVDRKRELKWLFPQERATLHVLDKDHIDSERSLGSSFELFFEVAERYFQYGDTLGERSNVANHGRFSLCLDSVKEEFCAHSELLNLAEKD